MVSSLKHILVGLVLVALTHSVIVPLRPKDTRCMFVFSYGGDETVKLEMNFPKIPDRQDGEYYEIEMTNTNTMEKGSDRVTKGVYKHQLSVDSNVVYQICFRVNTYRDIGVMRVEYNAHTQFAYTGEAIKVPDHLLKSHDLENTYRHAYEIKKIGDRFLEIQKKRAEMESKNFESTKDMGNSLVTVSRIELGIVIVAAVYQLLAVRKYLQNKQLL